MAMSTNQMYIYNQSKSEMSTNQNVAMSTNQNVAMSTNQNVHCQPIKNCDVNQSYYKMNGKIPLLSPQREPAAIWCITGGT